MLLFSSVLELAGRVAGPRTAFDIRLWRTARWRNFEPEFYLLDHLVDKTRAAIDVGSNEGLYAGRLAQLCPHVHCFEPIPWMAADLRKKLRPKVLVHDVAASDTDGVVELRIPYRGDLQMHGTATVAVENPLEDSTGVERLQIRRIRLDSVVTEPVGFIKIDVEGHEIAVLHGAAKLIAKNKPVILVESETRHSPLAPESVINFMNSLGYSGIFLLNGLPKAIASFKPAIHQPRENVQGVIKVGTYVNNFIFIPPDQL